MQDPRTSLKKLVQLAAFGYLLVAILYTTSCLLVYPLSSVGSYLSGNGAISLSGGSSQGHSSHPRIDLIGQILQIRGHSDTDDKQDSLSSFLASDDPLYWPHSGSGDRSFIREGTFLSKAFSQSMHPTKIIPFFYKASGPIDEGDVTITTLVTSNRFKVLKKLVERYQGMGFSIHSCTTLMLSR